MKCEKCEDQIEDFIEEYYIKDQITTKKLCGRCITIFFFEYLDNMIFQGDGNAE